MSKVIGRDVELFYFRLFLVDFDFGWVGRSWGDIKDFGSFYLGNRIWEWI